MCLFSSLFQDKGWHLLLRKSEGYFGIEKDLSAVLPNENEIHFQQRNFNVKLKDFFLYKGNKYALAVFTLEDEQIVWTDKSSQTDKSSDVKTGRTNFQTTLSSQFVRLFVRL